MDYLQKYLSYIKQYYVTAKMHYSISDDYAVVLLLKQDYKCALTNRPISPLEKNLQLVPINKTDGYCIGNVQWIHSSVDTYYLQYYDTEIKKLAASIFEEGSQSAFRTVNFLFQKMSGQPNQEEFYFNLFNINKHKNTSRYSNKIVVVSGGMDVPHEGHIAMINEASNEGKVVVLLNSDEWLIRKKGYFYLPFEQRKAIVSEFKNVSLVLKAFDNDDSVCESLIAIRPDYFANGGDRQKELNNVPEAKVCSDYNIKMLWEVGGSQKMKSSSDFMQNALDQFCKNHNLESFGDLKQIHKGCFDASSKTN